MLEELLSQDSIIVSDHDYNQVLFSFKNRYPSIKFKVITPNELIDRLSFSYNQDIVPLLISHGIEYSKAKKYERLLRVSDISKNDKLSKTFSYIPKEYLSYDPYGIYELQNKKIYLFEMDSDIELKNLLYRNGLNSTNLHFEDLGITKEDTFNNPNIIYFQNKYTQFFYIFSDIRKRIIEDETIKNKIRLVIENDADLFYVKIYSSLFDIPCYATVSSPMISDSSIKEKLAVIYKTKSFAFEDYELENESIKSLQSVISRYALDTLDSFDFAYSNLLEIVSSNSFTELMDDKGILVTNKYSFDNRYITYITNFKYGCFYKTYDDKNVLTDAELAVVDVDRSYTKTKLDREKKLNYIKYNNVVLFSRVKQHLADAIYDSQFMEKDELNWKSKIKINKTDFNLDGVYTESAKDIFFKDQYDRNTYKNTSFIDNHNYDHSYKGIDKVKEVVAPRNGRWSVTNLERYINCPFQYYLDKVINSKDGDPHNKWKGTLTHKVFENLLHKDFDFEESFKEGKEAYIKQCIDEGFVYGKKEEVYVSIIYEWLKKFIPSYIKVIENINLIENKHDFEQKVFYSIKDEEGKQYNFKGSIDKIIWSEYEGEKFYTIVDYKSGKEEFTPERVFLGSSTQLPLYYYAAENGNNYIKGKGKFGGAGIQHNYFSSIKGALRQQGKSILEEESLMKASRVHGLFSSDPNYLHSIDSSMFNDKDEPSRYGGLFLQRKTTKEFSKIDAEEAIHGLGKGYIENYNLEILIEDAKKATIETIKKIEQNEFPIKPASFLKNGSLDDLACSHCPYRNVCYVNKNKDAHEYIRDINAKFKVANNIQINEESEDEVDE